MRRAAGGGTREGMRARLLCIAGVVVGLVASPEGAAQSLPKAATASPAKTTTPKGAKAKEPEPELPPAEARLWVIAPAIEGPWTLRIDNTGPKPVRIPADVRLLEMEIDLPEPPDPPEDTDPKKKKKPVWTKKKPAPKPLTCSLPDALRPRGFPEDRALLLAPGESYIERFDPNLFCFGKSGAGLVGSATIRSHFGWKPPKKTPWGAKKPPSGPFAVEGTEFPAVFAPEPRIAAPTIRLSFTMFALEDPKPAVDGDKTDAAKEPGDANTTNGSANPTKMGGAEVDQAKLDTGAKTEAGAPETADKDHGKDEAKRPPIVDENAPRLEIMTARYQDAAAERNVSIKVTAKNAGRRPMLAALRPRMLSFRVIGPDGAETACGADTLPRGMPREAFRSYKPDESTSFTVLLAEICPRGTFGRPGLYRVTPTLHAQESGSSIGLAAYTAVVSAPLPALIRVQSGSEPFYSSPPKAVPTPRQMVMEDDASTPPPTPAEPQAK